MVKFSVYLNKHVFVMKPTNEPQRQKSTSDTYAQRRFKSTCASVKSDQSLPCPQEEILTSLAIQNALSDESDQTARMPECAG